MKDYKKILGHLIRKWRKQQGVSLYKIAKEEGGNIRIETLKKVENGEEVRTDGLMKYLHYCHAHGYDVIDAVWKYNTVEKELSDEKTTEVINTLETPIENQSKEPVTSHTAGNKQELVQTPLSVTLNTPPSPQNNLSVEMSNNNRESVFGKTNLPSSAASKNNITCNPELLTEEQQIKILKKFHCPVCGANVRDITFNGKTFIGHTNFDRNKPDKCTYRVGGTTANPIIYDNFKGGVVPKSKFIYIYLQD